MPLATPLAMPLGRAAAFKAALLPRPLLSARARLREADARPAIAGVLDSASTASVSFCSPPGGKKGSAPAERSLGPAELAPIERRERTLIELDQLLVSSQRVRGQARGPPPPLDSHCVRTVAFAATPRDSPAGALLP